MRICPHSSPRFISRVFLTWFLDLVRILFRTTLPRWEIFLVLFLNGHRTVIPRKDVSFPDCRRLCPFFVNPRVLHNVPFELIASDDFQRTLTATDIALLYVKRIINPFEVFCTFTIDFFNHLGKQIERNRDEFPIFFNHNGEINRKSLHFFLPCTSLLTVLL